MKQINVIIITIMFLIAGLLAGNIAISQENSPQIITSGQYGKGYRYNIQGWVYLHIEGEPYERGYQYGYLGAAEIVDMIDRWSTYGREVKIMNLFYLKDPTRWWELCKSITMRTAWKEYPEEYQDEIRGIADGVKAKGGKVHGQEIGFEDIATLNEMQACWYSLTYFWKRFHPIRNVINGVKNLFTDKSTGEEEGFCSVFIATGDATVDGEIVAVHSTQPLYYLDERFNFIIDVQPSQGNRFVMVGTPPGFIWSLVNYYQNDKGIVLMESTLPQGPWKKKGTPIAVRSRNAIQYSDCIDDVLENLLKGNNGLYECEWLIGDSKTGEIASIELALYNTPIKRTYNGFYWSCNYPHDPKVKRELSGGIPTVVSNLISNVFENSASLRAEKFQELERKYYGQIDTEIAKRIISTSPICINSCDGKITTTKLMKNMGLLAHMGNPNGSQWNPTDEEKKKFKLVTELPPSGWVEVYPSDIKSDNEQKTNIYNTDNGNSRLLKVYDEESVKDIFDSSTKNNDSLFYGSRDGNLYALNSNNGKVKWKYQTQWGIVSTPVVSEGLVLVGSLDNNFYAINNDTGEMEWSYTCNAAIHSSPAVYGDLVFFGCDDGRLYALNKTDGKFAWSFTPKYSIKNNANNYMTTPITCDPIVKDGVVYIEVNEKIYALDSQTEEKPVEVDNKKSEDYTIFIVFALLGVILLIISAIIHIYNKKQEEINDE